MPRDIPVGNGNMLVAFDKYYRLRELYYPFVGQESHTAGHAFRLGFWVNGAFSWIGEGWETSLRYVEDTMVTDVVLRNSALGIEARSNDAVDFRENIFIRKMTVVNETDRTADVRVFFHHDFHIFGTDVGDTANYQPDTGELFHFKEKRCFFMNASVRGRQGFAQFATGNKELPQREGTWKDAEDGKLSGNPIAQGAVDSVGAVHLSLAPRSSETLYYWICAGIDWHGAAGLNTLIMKETPEAMLRRTADYWHLWVTQEPLRYELLPRKVAGLYKRSLLITRTQIDNRGGILAANDSDSVGFNRDTYSYVWPRDASLTAYALDLAGYSGLTQRYFEFCSRVMHDQGYFLHKYTPSGAEGSSWHPWYDPQSGEAQLPIQEDETALVIWALWNHYRIYRDIEFIRPLYDTMIKRAAEFMFSYRDWETGLPLPSYDPWEERRGVLTYTVSTTVAGLEAAANFAAAFGEHAVAGRYSAAADEVRQGMLRYLYLNDEQRFARMINFRRDGTVERDTTVDASLFAVFAFGVLPLDDHRVVHTMEQVRDTLWSAIGVGGLARYSGDAYHRVSRFLPGNPWIIATLWLAKYYIDRAKTRQGLEQGRELLEWVCGRALPSGVLAEQINPMTGEPLSVSPLTWSQSTFVAVVREYLEKLSALEPCPACGRPGRTKYSVPEEKVLR